MAHKWQKKCVAKSPHGASCIYIRTYKIVKCRNTDASSFHHSIQAWNHNVIVEQKRGQELMGREEGEEIRIHGNWL